MTYRTLLCCLFLLVPLAGCATKQAVPPDGRVTLTPPAPDADPLLPVTGQMADVPLEGLITPPAEPADAAPLIADSKRYFKGEGVAVDKVQAAALLRRAADMGSAQAAFTLALFKMRGEGMAQDIQGGMVDLAAVARRGHAEAAAMLGERLIPRDPDRYEKHFGQAVYWLSVARRAGHEGVREGHRTLLEVTRRQRNLPAITGSGDSLDDPLRFDPDAIASDAKAAEAEKTVADILYPGWKQESRGPIGGQGQERDRLLLINSSGQKAVLYFDRAGWTGKGLRAAL